MTTDRLDRLATGGLADADAAWTLRFDGYDPDEEGRRETVCALGNGYLVTRAAAPDADADDVHYPGTYRAALYDRLTTHLQGETNTGARLDAESDDESLVNLPNWLPLTFRVDGGPWFHVDAAEVLAYEQVLDLRCGLLRRTLRVRDRAGRVTRLRERRIVSVDQPHLGAIALALEPENWSGVLDVRAGIDGGVVNGNVPRYAPFRKRHLETTGGGAMPEGGVWLAARTQRSGIDVAVAARTRVWVDGRTVARGVEHAVDRRGDRVCEHLRCAVRAGEGVVVEKVAALYTGRDVAHAGCVVAAQTAAAAAGRFDALLAAHRRGWARLWRRTALDAGGERYLRRLRLHAFHVLQTASPHTVDLDAGIPAHGWHGEEYRGHVFWDELFVFPFLILRFPTTARALLLYRYRRLAAARRRAREAGREGALFPWRSASTGAEETPPYQFNPLSGRWVRDDTRLQRHIGAVVAYNVWSYVAATGDDAFLADYGAELLVAIARFWTSAAEWNAGRGRYEIRGVVGPDEFHTGYPDDDAPGVDNNAFTNVMASWALRCARAALDRLSAPRRAELAAALEIGHDEPERWDEVSRRLYVPFAPDGTLRQFEGAERLRPFDLDAFRARHGDVRIDWTLEAEGDAVKRYDVTKQADVSLLAYLFTCRGLSRAFAHLGYTIDMRTIDRTVLDALGRTAHASSLSYVAFAGALARIDPDASWRLFEQAQAVDLSPDLRTGSTKGVSLGAMAGTIAVLQHHYAGLHVEADGLRIDPALPGALESVRLAVRVRGAELAVEVTRAAVVVRSLPGHDVTVAVRCRGRSVTLAPGDDAAFPLQPASRPRAER